MADSDVKTAGGLSLVGRHREEDIHFPQRSEMKESPLQSLLNMGKRFEPWHIYVMQLLTAARILSDRSLSPPTWFAAAELLERVGFGRHEGQEGALKAASRSFLVDTLKSAVSYTLASSLSASSSSSPSLSVPHFCCPCCYHSALQSLEAQKSTGDRQLIASVKVLLNGSHWLVLGVLLEPASSLSPPVSSPSTIFPLPPAKVCGIVVLGTIQQAREIAWPEIEASLRKNFESVVQDAATGLGLSCVSPLPISYAQGLQYGNQGCGFATDYNHQLLLTGHFDLSGGKVCEGDRVEIVEGYDVMILHLANENTEESVETRHLSDEEYAAFQKGELSLQGEVLDAGRHRHLQSYHDRSVRTPWTVEASLRLELFLSLSQKRTLHAELLQTTCDNGIR